MSNQLVSVDAGNGGVNAVRAMKRGYRQTYFPSVRAAATGDSLDLGSQFELEFETIDWGGHRYVVGDDVLHISQRGVERHQGAFRYGDEFHRFLVTVAVARLGIKRGKVDLTLFAPPGLFREASQTIKERFLDKGGKVAIQFKSDSKPRVWEYSSVTVWPEGIGAAACFAINDQGELQAGDTLAGDTVILDLGMYTLDALQMRDGNFNPESLQNATWEGQGIRAHILEPILNTVRKMSEDFQLLTLDAIDVVIRTGLETGDYHLRKAGLAVDLKPLLDKTSQRYAEWIANNIIDGVFSGLRGFKSLILVGGGAVLTQDYFPQWYDESKLLRFDAYAATKNIAAVDANTVGGIRLAKMRQKA